MTETPDGGVYFLHATAGARTLLTKDEYDALMAKLDELRAESEKLVKGAPPKKPAARHK